MSEFGAEFCAELGADGVRAAGDGAGGAFGSARRALKVEMKSITAGESPSRFVKWSIASVLESVEA